MGTVLFLAAVPVVRGPAAAAGATADSDSVPSTGSPLVATVVLAGLMDLRAKSDRTSPSVAHIIGVAAGASAPLPLPARSPKPNQDNKCAPIRLNVVVDVGADVVGTGVALPVVEPAPGTTATGASPTEDCPAVSVGADTPAGPSATDDDGAGCDDLPVAPCGESPGPEVADAPR
jgi:hypothetical protein